MIETVTQELLAYQNDRIKDYADANTKVDKDAIVFVGDSIIEFYPLRKYFSTSKPIYNRGIAGIDIQWLIDHLDQQILELSPSQIVLLVGTNDIGLGHSETLILKRMQTLIQSIRAFGIKAPITLLSILPVSKNSQFAKTVKVRSNELIDRLNHALAQLNDVDFLDVNHVLKDAEGGLADSNTKDGLHLNLKGYEQISRVIGEKLSLGTKA
ncbi:SGNH/GDSL hydrolase family protein [Streptococcus halichoeri]|uniref:SGNH/GDSL hydrolase family protein n=1 Tax=Streptococcus halichoeri TaxID=254785 RepID=UPI0013581595|nr:SGNH/GDSL hydrolase family protein [Streptococcus halichoeri]